MAMLETPSAVTDSVEFELDSDSTWKQLYSLLESPARYFVYSSHIPSWRGQEKEIIEDIVQETARRIIERSQKVARGEAPPIHYLKSMLFAVARNYCTDLCRRDHRFVRMQPQDAVLQAFLDPKNQVDPAEEGVENVYLETLFRHVAREVAAFPDKQRRAILTDIAIRMHFGRRRTPLQRAFLEAGIDLREYRQALPSNPRERARHDALVNCAYKRVASLREVHQYISPVLASSE
jgi:DNA-directed RNA polymerase specialized sigma24 family protein